ncbi:MAG: hypothetical protein OXI77_01235 [Chloroflexota bacterium]|nr:hypothetical protein [Chloroflexota bacterium]MDE2908758.1 hypothetical protein [Chloroflexota bacterium]
MEIIQQLIDIALADFKLLPLFDAAVDEALDPGRRRHYIGALPFNISSIELMTRHLLTRAKIKMKTTLGLHRVGFSELRKMPAKPLVTQHIVEVDHQQLGNAAANNAKRCHFLVKALFNFPIRGHSLLESAPAAGWSFRLRWRIVAVDWDRRKARLRQTFCPMYQHIL